MAKVRNLSDNQKQIAFTEFDFYQQYVETFKSSELGRIKSLLPLREMAISFGLIGLQFIRKLFAKKQAQYRKFYTFEINSEDTFTRCEKYSSCLIYFRSLIRIFAVTKHKKFININGQ